MISSLKYAISRDRNYFVKAVIDPMYKDIRHQIDSLLQNILEETRKNVQIQVANLEKYIKKMEKWFFGNYASNDELRLYDSVKNKIKEIHSKLSLHSYFDYDDALQLAFSAKEEVNKIQLSIKTTLSYSENRIQSNETALKNTSNELSKRSFKYYTDMLKSAFVGFGIPITYIYVGLWIVKNISLGVGYLILSLILGIIGIILSLAAGLLSLGHIMHFFEAIKEYISYKNGVKDNNNNMTNEIIILKQKIAIAKESII